MMDRDLTSPEAIYLRLARSAADFMCEAAVLPSAHTDARLSSFSIDLRLLYDFLPQAVRGMFLEYEGSMARSRLLSFFGGRLAASLALYHAGASTRLVGRASSGRPVWPCGYAGSITHSPFEASAAVGETSEIRAVGIDSESLDRAEAAEDIVEWCLSASERERHPQARTSASYAISLFSIKEAAFKCFCADGTEPGSLRNIAIETLDPASGEFVVLDLRSRTTVHGRTCVAREHVHTVLLLGAENT